MANLHRILGRGAIRWRIVDPWPGPVTQGLLSMVVVVVVVVVKRLMITVAVTESSTLAPLLKQLLTCAVRTVQDMISFMASQPVGDGCTHYPHLTDEKVLTLWRLSNLYGVIKIVSANAVRGMDFTACFPSVQPHFISSTSSIALEQLTDSLKAGK